MSEPFDRELLARKRRAAPPRDPNGLDALLIRHAADDMLERLRSVKRDFPLALALDSDAAELLKKTPSRVIIRALPISNKLTPKDDGGRVLSLAADEEALPFADASFDIAVSLMSLHWVNDLPGTLARIGRALRPDGLFMGAFLGSETLSELREAFLVAESEIKGGAAPRIAPFPDLRGAGDLLARAALALPVADRDRLTLKYASMDALLRDIRGMTVPNIMTARSRLPMRRDVLRRAGEIYGDRFASPDGRARATFEILYLTGWAKASGQPKAARRGSGQMNLGKALEAIKRERESGKSGD